MCCWSYCRINDPGAARGEACLWGLRGRDQDTRAIYTVSISARRDVGTETRPGKSILCLDMAMTIVWQPLRYSVPTTAMDQLQTDAAKSYEARKTTKCADSVRPQRSDALSSSDYTLVSEDKYTTTLEAIRDWSET